MLSERQQRSLNEIENDLRASDDRLATRFSLFAELVQGQEMPRREELPSPLRQRMGRLGGSAALPPHAGAVQWVPRVVLLLPALLMAITCMLMVVNAPPHDAAACARAAVPASVGSVPAAGQHAGRASGCAAKRPSARHR